METKFRNCFKINSLCFLNKLCNVLSIRQTRHFLFISFSSIFTKTFIYLGKFDCKKKSDLSNFFFYLYDFNLTKVEILKVFIVTFFNTLCYFGASVVINIFIFIR